MMNCNQEFMTVPTICHNTFNTHALVQMVCFYKFSAALVLLFQWQCTGNVTCNCTTKSSIKLLTY